MSAQGRPRASVVVTGSELLTGAIADRNGPWLSRELVGLGFEVAHVLVVGDRPDDLAAALRFTADAGSVLVVTSGGLGPTADDLTAEVVAGFAGVELELDKAMRSRIAGILAELGRRSGFERPGAGRGQPQAGDGAARGAVALTPVGTAPGLVVSAAGRAAGRRVAGSAARAAGDVAGRAGRAGDARAAGRRAARGVAVAALRRAARVGDRGHAARARRRRTACPASR